MDEAYFRARYETDEANRKRQSWDEHAKWVRTFYEGKSFPPVPGWAARERSILAALPEPARAATAPRLQDLARRLASEWAKDNAVRKVSTSDLQTWGKALESAAKADTGDGAKVLAALEAQSAELAKRGV